MGGGGASAQRRQRAQSAPSSASQSSDHPPCLSINRSVNEQQLFLRAWRTGERALRRRARSEGKALPPRSGGCTALAPCEGLTAFCFQPATPSRRSCRAVTAAVLCPPRRIPLQSLNQSTSLTSSSSTLKSSTLKYIYGLLWQQASSERGCVGIRPYAASSPWPLAPACTLPMPTKLPTRCMPPSSNRAATHSCHQWPPRMGGRPRSTPPPTRQGRPPPLRWQSRRSGGACRWAPACRPDPTQFRHKTCFYHPCPPHGRLCWIARCWIPRPSADSTPSRACWPPCSRRAPARMRCRRGGVSHVRSLTGASSPSRPRWPWWASLTQTPFGSSPYTA